MWQVSVLGRTSVSCVVGNSQYWVFHCLLGPPPPVLRTFTVNRADCQKPMSPKKLRPSCGMPNWPPLCNRTSVAGLRINRLNTSVCFRRGSLMVSMREDSVRTDVIHIYIYLHVYSYLYIYIYTRAYMYIYIYICYPPPPPWTLVLLLFRDGKSRISHIYIYIYHA